MKTCGLDYRQRDHISPRSVIRSNINSMTPPHTRSSSPMRFLSPCITISPNEDLSDHDSKSDISQQQKLIPFVSKITLQQALPLIFSAFWDGANLYTDVLGLNPSKREALSSARLRLAYFRKGREVLASPVEVDDEVTTLTYQGISAPGLVTNTAKLAIRSGVPISRKAKKRFQAICLAYEVLSDHQTRAEYDAFLKHHHHRQTSFVRQGYSQSFSKLDTIIERISAVSTSREMGKSKSSRQLAREEASINSYYDSRHFLNDLDVSMDNYSSSDHDLSRSMSTNYSGLDGILRPTNAQRSRRPVTPSKIRWNEQVEELVIMDYDAQNEHSVQPYDTVDKKHTGKKVASKNSAPRSHDDDVWSSSNPFFPEQDADIPFDESGGCYFPSRKMNMKNKSKKYSNGKNINKGNRRHKNDCWESEYDNQDEPSMDESGSMSCSRHSQSEKGKTYEHGGFEKDDDDCGAFDLAAGFQVALSKYLGNVLSEMKSGLSELGRTFSDIDLNQDQVPNRNKPCGNEFFMDDYEVNALMSVLRSEMNQNPVNT